MFSKTISISVYLVNLSIILYCLDK